MTTAPDVGETVTKKAQMDRWREIKFSLHLMRKSPLFIIGSAIVVVFIVLAVFAPFIAPYPPTDINVNVADQPPLSPDTRVEEFWHDVTFYDQEAISKAVSASIANVDDNDIPDLIVGMNDGRIKVYQDFYLSNEELNNENGEYITFSNGSNVHLGSDISVSSADINGNDQIDMLVGNAAGELFWLEQSTTGATWEQNPFTLPINSTGRVQPTLYNYDPLNGSLIDLIVADGNGTIFFYENVGNTTHPDFLYHPETFERIVYTGGHRFAGEPIKLAIGVISFKEDRTNFVIYTDGGDEYLFTKTARYFTSDKSLVELSSTDVTFKYPYDLNEVDTAGLIYIDLDGDDIEDLIHITRDGKITYFYRTTKENFPIHVFGTDELGKDVFSRVIWALQIDLITSIWIVFVAICIGTVLGSLSGYFGGKVDTTIMRSTDVFFAFPGILLALAVASVLGRDLFNLSLALIIVWWPQYTRLIRGQILLEKEKAYVEAARALGYSDVRILFRHILPNSWYPILVQATLDLGAVILNLAGLSFIGFGVPSGEAELGRMIADGRKVFLSEPWIAFFPGLIIFLIVLGWNLVGDGLRDILDPQLRR